ncbi:S-adenosyl-L-methionine-dependent methyltransferase [Pleomassaria siparia CBS 279.74]|uniref:S-adenosyl-L-methionine-dependent methyltransferase n=1 Tax=Pleomassaria siparia CBS 279.74 TaxID=1314801 RepID=A0A6G1KPT8_9PLEO|nr:S-adenosyl-L-methionine-dependent methyltransferase [Pleomassaria siparia CBS 279.74]
MPSSVSSVLKEIGAKGASFTDDVDNEDARKALLESARSLVASLESPLEVIARMNWLEPTRWAVTQVALDLHLFEALSADDGSPKTSDALANETGCDERLMSRLLKHLNSAGFVIETGANEYSANEITKALAKRIPADDNGDTDETSYGTLPLTMARLPEFLKLTGYQNPTDKDKSAFKFAFGTDQHYFEYINQPGNEGMSDSFQAHMEFKTLGKKWFQSVDVEEVFDHPTDATQTLMVDIGGSIGHDIIDFHAAFPNVPGKLVLQDLPTVIDTISPTSLPENIRAQAHDFFNPQPVQSAKAYYLHMVLHDWPDESCRKILSSITPAMKRGYSKILLNEIVISDTNADWFSTSVDMLMLFVHSAQERTEDDWGRLLGSVGLKITKIWDCDGNPEKIIEVELA